MARLLKNPLPHDNANFAIQMPIVPSSAFGDAPANGLLRFNQASSRIEFYYNGAWSQVAKIGSVTLLVDSSNGGTNGGVTLPYGDGTTQVFTMGQQETDPNAIAVFVGGVYQEPNNYTVSGYSITFSVAPPLGTINRTQITIIHNINSTNVPA